MFLLISSSADTERHRPAGAPNGAATLGHTLCVEISPLISLVVVSGAFSALSIELAREAHGYKPSL